LISNRPAVEESGAGDLPTTAAQLKIGLESVQFKAEGKVPPAGARHLITTVGIVGSVASSTAGAIITHGSPDVAFAELVLGLVAAVLIAVRGRDRRQPPPRPSLDDGAGPAGADVTS
jgi:multisubunit Na+/H+ antiporter MnhB subunit